MKTSRCGSLVFASFALTALIHKGCAANLRSKNESKKTSSVDDNHHRVLQQDEDGILLEADIQYDPDSEEQNLFERHLKRPDRPENSLNIQLSDGSIYELSNLNPNWKDGEAKGQLHSGRTTIKINAGATISGGKIDLGGGKPEIIGTSNGHQRSLATTTGDKTMLAVRVILSDGQYSSSEDELSDYIFGTFGSTVSFKSQMEDCSYNQLTISKASDRTGSSTNISNGVVTITLNGYETSDGDSSVRNAVTSELQNQFGVSATELANHVMYCLPSGTSSSIAYAYVNSWMSVYSDQWCNRLSAQMHEIGHNINLAHAGESSTYDDQTGVMGYSYSSYNGPKMCYNAAKSYQLGWYSDGTIEIDITNGDTFDDYIYGVSDYSGSARTVLLKVNTSSSTDYYVAFNRKTGINSATQEAGDMVTIVKQGGEGTSYATSELLAKLDSDDDTYVFSNLSDLNESLVVTVKSIDTSSSPGYAHVSVGYSSNLPPTRAPTKPPTNSPTPQPTLLPTRNPTPQPTNLPPPPKCFGKSRRQCKNDVNCRWVLTGCVPK